MDCHLRVAETSALLPSMQYMYTTPRDFLDFINKFRDLAKEKREEVLQLQRHLNVGLTKLLETATTVPKSGRWVSAVAS